MKYILGFIKRIIREYKTPIRLHNIRSILVVDPNFIGDMLFSSPVYKALKNNLPNARVEALVYPFTREILSANPFIDQIHFLPEKNLLQQLWSLLHLRKRKFDLLLQLNTSLKTNFFIWIIGGRYRLGYDYCNRGCFNNIRIPIATRTARTRYRIDECVDLLELAFGWKVVERQMILSVPVEDEQKVPEMLKELKVDKSDTLIGIQANCRSTWEERKWEKSKFAAMTNELIKKYNAKIVFTGSKEDSEYVKAIMQSIERPENVASLVGKTTLMELAALLQRINVFITVNTGPMQIAVSRRTPTVVLMGVTPPIITYPMDVPIFQYVWLGEHAVSNQLAVDPKDSMRMRAIEVHHVLEKVNYLLQLQKKPFNAKTS